MSFETFAFIWPFMAIGASIGFVFLGIWVEKRLEQRKSGKRP
jgi:hypothetical protein